MFCRYCGKEIPDTAKFCRYCGKNLEAAEGKQPEKQSEKQPEKKKKVVLLILCVVLALLLVAVVGLAAVKFVNENRSSDRQEEQEHRNRADRDNRKDKDKEDKEDKEDNLPGESIEAGMFEQEESAPASQVEVATSEEAVLEASQAVEVAQYILPESDSRFLTKDDLDGLTQEECRLARNELFARHGRIFQDESLRAYFESLEWYQGTVLPDDFDESVFNEYEFANRDLIVEYEKEQGYR